MKQTLVIFICVWQACHAGLSLPTVRIAAGGSAFSMGSSSPSVGSSHVSSVSGPQSSFLSNAMPRIRFSGGKPSLVVGKPNYIAPQTSSSSPSEGFQPRPFHPMPFHPMVYPMMNPMMMRPRFPMMPHGMQPWAAASMRMPVRVPYPMPIMPIMPMMRRPFRGFKGGFGDTAAASGIYNSMYNNPFSSGFSMNSDKFTASDDNDYKITEYKVEDGSTYKPEEEMPSEYKTSEYSSEYTPSSGDQMEGYKTEEEMKKPESEYKPSEEYKSPESDEYSMTPPKDAYESLTGQQDDGQNTDYLTLVGKQISMKNPKTGKMKHQPLEGGSRNMAGQPYTGKAQTYSPSGSPNYYGESPSVTEAPKYEQPAPKCAPCPKEAGNDDEDDYERPRKSKKTPSYDDDEDDDDSSSSSYRKKRPMSGQSGEDCHLRKPRVRPSFNPKGRSGSRKTLNCECREEPIKRKEGKRGKRSTEELDKLLLTPQKRVMKIPSPQPTLSLDDKGEVVASISKAIAEALERNSEVYTAIGISRKARRVEEIVSVVENPRYHPHRPPVIHKHPIVHHPVPHHAVSPHRGHRSHVVPHHPNPFVIQDPLVSMLLQQ